MHTLAPERAGALAAIRRLVDAGVLVSVGHSDATASQTEAAADAGARLVTHLFNAMRPLHHREPGVVGQAPGRPAADLGLIADLHHVAAPVCRLAFARRPRPDRAGHRRGRGRRHAAGHVRPGRPAGLGRPGRPPRRGRRHDRRLRLRLDAAVANVVAAG